MLNIDYRIATLIRFLGSEPTVFVRLFLQVKPNAMAGSSQEVTIKPLSADLLDSKEPRLKLQMTTLSQQLRIDLCALPSSCFMEALRHKALVKKLVSILTGLSTS